MNSQSYILLAIGVFVSLIVTVAAVDHYLFEEHPPTEVAGLIWRVENALSRIKDLEAIVEVTENETENGSLRMRVKLLNQPVQALWVHYLSPASLKDQIFTVENDLLSHALPDQGLIVVRRWVGLPLAAVGLAGLDLSQLKDDWDTGKLRLQVLQNVPTFSTDLFSTSIALHGTLTDSSSPFETSFCPGLSESDVGEFGFTRTVGTAVENAIRGEYILEARDAATGELTQMVWIDRETYLVGKVVFFSDGRRDKSIQLRQTKIDQGMTLEDVLTLPRGLEVQRG
ncbi:MAG: hypothetical protein WBC63_03370 [Candidatus Bipolaricaulia bacterium]